MVAAGMQVLMPLGQQQMSWALVMHYHPMVF